MSMTMTFAMSDMNGHGMKVVIEEASWKYCNNFQKCTILHIFQDEEENEEQTLTMKEIEENKKKEKELQQKKVQNNNLAY